MKKVIITIGREYGSGGREIGEKLAKALDFSFYDRNLIDLVAEKSGMNSEVLHQADEKASNPFFNTYIPTGIDFGTVNDRLFWNQSAIIKDIASKESCVIVGRCANYILQDYEDAVHVFIYAPLEDRIKRIMDKYLIETPQAAKKEIHREDKYRRSYYQYYTDMKWGDRESVDIAINSSLLGIDGTVELIKSIIEKHFA